MRRDVELPDLAGGRLAHLALACRELRIVPHAAPPPPALASLHVLLEARSGRARAADGLRGWGPLGLEPCRAAGAGFWRAALRAACGAEPARCCHRHCPSRLSVPKLVGAAAPPRRRRALRAPPRARPRALTPPARRGRPRRRRPRRGWRRPARRSAACTPATRTSAACWPSGNAGGRTRWTCARAGRRSCASWRPSTTAVRGRAAALPHPKPMCWTCTRTGRRSCASWRLFEQPWAPGAGGCLRAAVPDA